MPDNVLYYGDNLKVLREHVADESVDLVYLDPPFNSNADYNVLFSEKGGEKAHAQIQAFEDTWEWDQEASANFADAVQNGGEYVAKCLLSFRALLGASDMLAYLAMMAPRLVELSRVLKPTGSIFLHCDDTASHYLKLLMDAVFRPDNFINEIIWERSQTRSSISRSFRRAHDVILFYSRSDDHKFNMQYRPLSDASMNLYDHEDAGGKYQGVPLLVSGKRNGKTGAVWRGIDPNVRGKAGMHWVTIPANLDEYEKKGLILWPDKKDGTPRLKYYLHQSPGVPLNDIWDDVPLISSSAAESLGYPTQKPEALLERIIRSGSDEGDVVLDPFCGCGTAVAASQRLDRRWLGIDVTHLAVNLIKVRLRDAFGEKVADTYRVVGEPEDLAGAQSLADDDKYQFQYWALGLVGARPHQSQQKKGADKGIDGRLWLTDTAGEVKPVIISVKGGHVTVSQVRDLRGVVEREDAAIGVFICIEEPTSPMRREAADAGFFESKTLAKSKHPRLQILTIEQLLNGGRIDMPPQADLRSFKQAPKAKGKQAHKQEEMFNE